MNTLLGVLQRGRPQLAAQRQGEVERRDQAAPTGRAGRALRDGGRPQVSLVVRVTLLRCVKFNCIPDLYKARCWSRVGWLCSHSPYTATEVLRSYEKD